MVHEAVIIRRGAISNRQSGNFDRRLVALVDGVNRAAKRFIVSRLIKGFAFEAG